MVKKAIDVHDGFFRTAMQHLAIAQEFFGIHLPKTIHEALDLSSFEYQDTSYIDEQLKRTMGDLVFKCRYNSDVEECKNKEATVILLVEHQSSPDRLMPFRVFHYLFNALYRILKAQPEGQGKLPPIYGLVFYHGKQTPYPFTKLLSECFDDPLNIMADMFNQPINIIDANEIEEDELKRQNLAGIMTGALKHSRDRDIKDYFDWAAKKLTSIDKIEPLPLEFVNELFYYLINMCSIADVKLMIKNSQQLPESARGEFMTIADELREMGREEGWNGGLKEGWNGGLKEGWNGGLEQGLGKAKQEVAINLLKEDMKPEFIARTTGLELSTILKLKADLEDEE
jgi:predicted transposase/invertase (TIGR01784 family)